MSVLSERTAKPRRERVVKNPFPWYTPRFWHGMRTSTWLSHLVTNRFDVSLAKLPTVASITGVSFLNSALAGIDRLIYGRRVSQTPLKAAPLFILGHWRSGTTFLHELLIRDPAHTYPQYLSMFRAPPFRVHRFLDHSLEQTPAAEPPADGQHGGRLA